MILANSFSEEGTVGASISILFGYLIAEKSQTAVQHENCITI